MKKISLVIIIVVLAFACVQSASASDTLFVYYAGPEGSVKTAIELAGFVLVGSPAQADVLFLNGTIPQLETMRSLVEKGMGLVLILGPTLSAESISEVTGIPLQIDLRSDPASCTEIKGL